MTEFGICSDKGRLREGNEDSYGSLAAMNLFVLSDGMGGLECGEVASRVAVDTILAHAREAGENPALPLKGPRIEGISDAANRLASALRLANDAVRVAAAERAAENGMGATVVAVQFDGSRVSIAHVGDSRAYRLRDDDFEQLTHDHSFIGEQVRLGHMTDAQASASAMKNILLRALGVDAAVDVEVSDGQILEGDTFLLCSDGLTNELSEAQIAAVLSETEDPQEAAERLVNLANEAGGSDNITAMVLRPIPRPVGVLGKLGRWLKV